MGVRLYGASLSYPSLAARAMLEHKGIEHDWVKLAPGLHPIQLRLAGFRGGTVPGLQLNGRRVVGSRGSPAWPTTSSPSRRSFPRTRHAVERPKRPSIGVTPRCSRFPAGSCGGRFATISTRA